MRNSILILSGLQNIEFYEFFMLLCTALSVQHFIVQHYIVQHFLYILFCTEFHVQHFFVQHLLCSIFCARLSVQQFIAQHFLIQHLLHSIIFTFLLYSCCTTFSSQYILLSMFEQQFVVDNLPSCSFFYNICSQRFCTAIYCTACWSPGRCSPFRFPRFLIWVLLALVLVTGPPGFLQVLWFGFLTCWFWSRGPSWIPAGIGPCYLYVRLDHRVPL